MQSHYIALRLGGAWTYGYKMYQSHPKMFNKPLDLLPNGTIEQSPDIRWAVSPSTGYNRDKPVFLGPRRVAGALCAALHARALVGRKTTFTEGRSALYTAMCKVPMPMIALSPGLCMDVSPGRYGGLASYSRSSKVEEKLGATKLKGARFALVQAWENLDRRQKQQWALMNYLDHLVLTLGNAFVANSDAVNPPQSSLEALVLRTDKSKARLVYSPGFHCSSYKLQWQTAGSPGTDIRNETGKYGQIMEFVEVANPKLELEWFLWPSR